MPQEMSDADVFGPDVHSLVTAAADRYSIPREILHNVAHTESGYSQSAISPRGAVGVMQLMPGTARDLGVDPTDAAQNVDGGARYLKAQHDRFGDWRLAAAAYNAGPGAVEKHGGVPPYPETQKYVDAVAPQTEMSDADVFGPQSAAPASPVISSHNGGVTIGLAGPDDGPPAPPPPARPQQVARAAGAEPKHGTPMDMALGYLSGLGSSTAQTADSVANFIPGLGMVDRLLSTGSVRQAISPDPLHLIGSLAQKLAQQHGTYVPQTTPGDYAKTAGLFTPAAAAPGSVPARIANVLMPAIASEGAGQATRALGGGPVAQQIARTGGALVGGGLASLRLNPVSAPIASPVDLLKAASDRAWDAVDASGFRFAKPAAQAVAKDITDTFASEGGAALYPKAAPLIDRINTLANDSSGLSVAQVNRLRSQIGTKLLQPGNDEADIGAMMKDKIESLIQTADDPSLAHARDIYTRLKKVQEVTNRTESADLRAASTYAGGNQANATRQNLRPLIDPHSQQQIRNLSPEEAQALNRVVRGTPAQNLMRTTGKVMDPRGMIGSTFNLLLGALTGGHAPLVTAPVGAAASALSNKMTAGSVQDLVQLMANGGGKAGAVPVLPQRQPLLSAPNSDAMSLAALISAIPAMSAAKAHPSPQAQQQR